MRSYYSHLQKLDVSAPKSPILRSSAIFPIFQENAISTRLIFLGYWLLKRSIDEIKAVITLRDINGQTVKQIPYLIREARAYCIEIKDLIEGFFIGTIEIEFYSKLDLVFPYPAVTINYYGPHFSAVVHTAERTYNDAEDAKKSSETHVAESGFNLYADANRSPLITLINGKEYCQKQTVQMDFYNSFEEKLSVNKELKPLNPFELCVLNPAEEFSLADFFQGKPGTCKMNFHLKGVFPRLLVGNRQKTPFGQVITHSYYDCKNALDPSNFWTPKDPSWHAASLMFPLMSHTHTTTISFYPIFSPSPFAIDLEIYNQAGKLKKSIKGILTFDTQFDTFQQISLDTLYPSDEIHSVRAYARALSETPIPSRIKFAIDIGVKDKGLPCNICTNLHPYIPAFTTKKTSFKWGPILADQLRNYAFLMNSSPEIEMTAPAEINLTFYREKDTEILEREVTLAPQSFLVINPKEDKELEDFLEGKIGWFTAITSNPYLTTYYFAENLSGIIGGDHGY